MRNFDCDVHKMIADEEGLAEIYSSPIFAREIFWATKTASDIVVVVKRERGVSNFCGLREYFFYCR